MHLNHLNLSVSNARAAADFFEQYFGFSTQLHNPANTLIAMTNHDFDLVLQEIGIDDQPPLYPPGFHLGFILPDILQVQATYLRLQVASVEGLTEIKTTSRGRQFFFVGPDGIMIEVGTHN
ncbi:VOC family protein [Undibacterium sp. Di27W]|uniref:VOC family protein n=1 Tax=Undibacterium sp. Di27W TaxID=3413036 RepID=UPI003BF33DFC